MQWTPPLWSVRSARLRIAFCCLLALYVVVSMRASLGIAMVCMVNSTAFAEEEFADLISLTNTSIDLSAEEDEEAEDACPVHHLDEKTINKKGYDGKLLWTPKSQSMLFSANYFGALATVLISGPIADKFGPKRNLLVAIAVLMVVSFLAPTLANHSYVAFYASRVVLGMAEAFVIPSINSLAGHWFPPTEKSSMAALYTSGNQLAAGSSGFVGSHMCGWSIGWPSIFYVFGSLGIVVWLIFFFVASDYPTDNRWIRAEEKEYLEGRVAAKKDRMSVPWRALLTCPQIHATLLCHFSNAFCVTLMHNYLPMYFKDELFLPLKSNGLYTIAPFVTQLLLKNVIASLSDYLKRTGRLTPTGSVKIFQSITSYGSAACLIGLAVFPSCHQPWLALVFLLAYGTFFSCGICGFFTSILSIAPAFTGTISSLSLSFGLLSSVVATNLVSLIIALGWHHKWLIVFSVGAVLQVITGTIFIFLGSAEVQEWAKLPEKSARLSMLDDGFNGGGFSDNEDDDFHRTKTLSESERSERDIASLRKSSREAALVRWTLSSGNEEPIIEEEDEENEDIYLNGKKVT